MDLSAAYAMSGVPLADPLGLITSDLVHQSDRGHALTSDVIHARLTAPVVVPPPAAAVTDIVAFDVGLSDVGFSTDLIVPTAGSACTLSGDLAVFTGLTQVGVRQSNGTTPDVAGFKNLTARAA